MYHQIININANIADAAKNADHLIENNVMIQVYPNPATDYVNVSINETSESKFNMLLTDEMGRVIRNIQLKDTETQIDFTQLSAGKYFIQVTNEARKTKESFKVIKVN